MEPIPIPKRVTFFTSGFHPSRFIDLVDEYFTCPICAWVVRGPIACAACETLYCKTCHDSVASLREDLCSACKRPFESAPLRLYPRTVYSRFKLCCSFEPYGCGFEATVSEMSSHEETCGYRLVECVNPRCCNEFRLKDRPFPHKLACSQRCLDCFDFLQLYQSGIGTSQCLEFFVTCVGKHKDRMKEYFRGKMTEQLVAAEKDLKKQQKEIEVLTKKLNSIKKQTTSEV